MRTNPSFPNQRAFLSVCAILFAFSIIIITSCEDHKPMGGGTPGSDDFKMNCVILTSKQVQAWVDSGWTKPDDPGRIKDLILQFYSPKGGSINSNLQMIGYPGQSPIDVKGRAKITLDIDTSCSTKSFTGAVAFANNEVLLDSLKIFDKEGKIIPFDYIRFTPTQRFPPYINFTTEVVRNGKVEATSGGGSLPCPPYCCPPDCWIDPTNNN